MGVYASVAPNLLHRIRNGSSEAFTMGATMPAKRDREITGDSAAQDFFDESGGSSRFLFMLLLRFNGQ